MIIFFIAISTGMGRLCISNNFCLCVKNKKIKTLSSPNLMCQLLWFNKLYKLPYPSTFITYFCFAIYYPLINGSFQTKNVAASTGRAAPAWKWKTICLMTMVRNLVICCHIGFVAYLPGAGVFLLSRRLLWFIDISAKWTCRFKIWLIEFCTEWNCRCLFR